MRYPGDTGSSIGTKGIVLLLAVATMFVTAGCEDFCCEVWAPERPPRAGVRVEVQVTDPSGEGVNHADVTLTIHETAECSSGVWDRISSGTNFQGRVTFGPSEETPSDFEPRDVCLDVLAEPPEDRPELRAAVVGSIIAALRSEDGERPIEELSVQVGLPSS